jgi:hypothetical protein
MLIVFLPAKWSGVRLMLEQYRCHAAGMPGFRRRALIGKGDGQQGESRAVMVAGNFSGRPEKIPGLSGREKTAKPADPPAAFGFFGSTGGAPARILAGSSGRGATPHRR